MGRSCTKWIVVLVVVGVMPWAARAGVAADCNDNGVPDDQDIAAGTSADCNANGVPDECDIRLAVSETAKLPLPDTTNPYGYDFQTAVAVDGDVAIVGAPFDDERGTDAGAAYIYRFNGSGWVQEAKLTASDGTAEEYFGLSVAIDGDVAAVGSFGVHDHSVYVYRFNGASWVQEAKLTGSGDPGDNQFGRSVAISGDVMVVGAQTYGLTAGAAYVYRWDGYLGQWVEEGLLHPFDAPYVTSSYKYFGNAVSVSGNTAIIGSYNDTHIPIDGRGSAYVYTFSGGKWSYQCRLFAPGTGNLGQSVSISGDVVVAGSPGTEGYVEGKAGSAHVFRRNGDSWVEEARLVPSDSTADDNFGSSVSVSGDIAVIGAHQNDADATKSGSAYIFRFDGNRWVEQAKLTASDASAGDHFGQTVDISGNNVFAGAYRNDGGGTDARSAYVFTWPDSPLDTDCNGNDVPDTCDLADGTSSDHNANNVPDECDIANGTSEDCNENGIPDESDIAAGTSADCNSNGVPDECEPDCNNNGTADACDIAAGTSQDCNGDGVPDECDPDCNNNGVPDGCDIVNGTSPDCNGNKVPDSCDIAGGTSVDRDGNGIPDDCTTQPPVAEAGPSRYCGSDTLVLDGTGSYDPDSSEPLTYQWEQISGSPVTLGQTNTATPTLRRTPDGFLHKVVLKLTVTDSALASSSDTVEVTIVGSSGSELSSSTHLENQMQAGQPFDPNKPTILACQGYCLGCKDPEWYRYANVISLDVPFAYDRAIVYLSKVAPYYDQPIEVQGFSGSVPTAFQAGLRLNSYFKDPRYNATRVTVFDGQWGSSLAPATFKNSAVDGEPTWYAAYNAGSGHLTFGLGVAVSGEHVTPLVWYRQSINRGFGDNVYNHGVTAGAFLSVAGPGKNYDFPLEAFDRYYFAWVKETTVQYADQWRYPGALPAPVFLIGPADGTAVPREGVTLGSWPSENAVRYQLLFGEDKKHLNAVLESDMPFTVPTGPLPAGKTLWWTVKAFERFGVSIFADPRSMVTPSGLAGDVNGDGVLDATDCALLKAALNTSWGHGQFIPAADLDGSQIVTCADAEAWLGLYRAFVQDPAAPDPCGLEDATDTDGDGVRDLCDNCPNAANADQKDLDGDGVGNVCDNCGERKNNNQLDSDGDGPGDLCDTDDDNDGRADPYDNCPTVANTDQTDADGDGEGDACDSCTDTDGDGFGNPGFTANTCPEDNCPAADNPDQANGDGDAWGDVCDNCPATVSADQTDTDADTVGDACDNCPAVANPDQIDSENDGAGDACDDDDDNDGVLDTADNCRTTANSDQADSDGDGVGDACDACPGTAAGVPVGPDGCATVIPGDFDQDGDVDLEDFGRFQLCLSGLNVPQTDPACAKARLDGDADVDQSDVDRFIACMSGPDIAGDEHCAE